MRIAALLSVGEGTCAATLEVFRDREAPVDPAFASGTSDFSRSYREQFASTP